MATEKYILHSPPIINESDVNGISKTKQRYEKHGANVIDKVILFGSALENRCWEESDINLEVFVNQPKGKCLTSKAFKEFRK